MLYRTSPSPASKIKCRIDDDQCVVDLLDLQHIVDGHSSAEAQEELLVYLARVLSADMYDSASIIRLDAAEHVCEVGITAWVENPGAFPMTPDLLESVYSYIAYHHSDELNLRDVLDICVPRSYDSLDVVATKERQLADVMKYRLISPPDLVLPHDLASHAMTSSKTFYLYRTRTDSERFEDKEHCSKLSKDLSDLFRLFKANLDHGSPIFPYFDDVIGAYRSGCCFPCLVCSDTFFWGCADAERIPASAFDLVMRLLDETAWSYNMQIAICSWLRNGQEPLPKYKTEEFTRCYEQICNSIGKPNPTYPNSH